MKNGIQYNCLYQKLQLELKLQGMSPRTIEGYSRAVRRVAAYFDRCPDDLSTEELKLYFGDLLDTHSWSSVKVERSGLQFFYRHVLRRPWTWIDMVRPPRVQHLPVPYFLTTFTLPAQLRTHAYAHQRIVYNALFRAGVEALRELAGDPKRLDGMMGMTGVLHTHSRRLDYHPHVHFIIPGGGLNRKGNRWKKANPRFLVWVKNLSRIFRGKFLAILIEKGVNFPRVLTQINWVVHCKPVGSGERALEYLARYLYRGVVCEEALTQNPDGSITLRYIDRSTDEPKTRNFEADAFLRTYLKHTLPKGFRRARDYGFLHGRNRELLVKLQLLLAVRLKRRPAQPRPRFCCPKCDREMSILAIHRHTTPLPIRGSPHAV